MFVPATPTTERVRIQNENAELNRYRVEQRSIVTGLISLLRFSRPKAERPVQTQRTAVRRTSTTKSAKSA
jgi:hypothetical protein